MALKVYIFTEKQLCGGFKRLGVVRHKEVAFRAGCRIEQPFRSQVMVQGLSSHQRRIKHLDFALIEFFYVIFDQRIMCARQYERIDLAQLWIGKVLGNDLPADLVVKKTFFNHRGKQGCGQRM